MIAYAVEINEMIEVPRVTALEYFTLRGVDEERRRRVVIEEEVEAPAFVAVRFFLVRTHAERARKSVEIRELVEKPSPAQRCRAAL